MRLKYMCQILHAFIGRCLYKITVQKYNGCRELIAVYTFLWMAEQMWINEHIALSAV